MPSGGSQKHEAVNNFYWSESVLQFS